MNDNDIFETWKERRSEIEVSNDFADKVMNQITAHEQTKTKFRFDLNEIFMRLSAYRLVKASLVAGSAIIGLARLIFMVRVALG
jgi:hypothetical protein